MCGIFAYTGSRTVAPILIDGLRTLEYRGYDSAGIFIPGYGAVKAIGPIDNLAKKIGSSIPGTCGIAHTRWATHGAPTETNAHPHTDMSERIWVVHNGIIENFREIKEILLAQGNTFATETDTEVLAKLIGSFNGGDLREAVQAALGMVRGTYGIAVASTQKPDEIVVARMGSPIVIGVGVDGYFAASDPSALLTHTKDVVYLEDGEVALLNKKNYTVFTLSGERRKKDTEKVTWDLESIQKGGYDHFLIKEIMEIPDTIRNTLRGRLIPERGRAKLGGLENMLPELATLERLMIVGCGSAAYAGELGRYILEEYAHIPIDVELGSEYRYRKIFPGDHSAFLAVTQSGETADTLASLRKAKEMKIPTIGIVNVVGSTIAREVDVGIYNHAGPEISIASTKAVVSQVVALILTALLIGRERGMIEAEGKKIVAALQALPETTEAVLKKAPEIKEIAKKYAQFRDAMFIGRNFHAPVAFEGALKLKEVTYIHADAYPAGELKHGSIAMLDENFPIIALAPSDDVYDKVASNIEEVRARHAPVLAIATEGDIDIDKIASDVIYVPRAHKVVQPILSLIPLYLLAYYVGVEKGIDVDRPRNLAKSVTVE